MRKLIAGMQMSLDGKIEGPERYAETAEHRRPLDLRGVEQLEGGLVSLIYGTA